LGSLHNDKGGEYMSREFEDFCIDHGIQRQHSARNRP
jgi:transposase InsO family protein